MEIEGLGAMIATMTRGGLRAELVMTGMRSMLDSFIDPAAEAVTTGANEITRIVGRL